MNEHASEVTRLLERWGEDARAREQLLAILYHELRHMAAGLMAGGRDGHTLQPTALVHEACLKLLGSASGFENRRHFFGAAARAMRQVLVDHARRKHADKRGGGQPVLALHEVSGLPSVDTAELIALDDALRQLEALDAQAVRIVELRWFAGLSLEQTAEVVGLHPSTVSAEWAHARAWLRRALDGHEPAQAVP